MLDIGLSEFFLIAVVALIFIGPKDLPVVVRELARCLRELRKFYDGMRKQMHDLVEEVGVEDLKKDLTTTIIDMEGNPQNAYDVRSLSELAAQPKKETP